MAMASVSASSSAVRRLQRDYAAFLRSENAQAALRPSPHSMLDYHFVLHSLPEDTPYRDGCYHGKLRFPDNFPQYPPKIIMLTPNGRLEPKQEICISMTDFLPGSWHPSWSFETILMGLISFILDDREETFVGCVQVPTTQRIALATASWEFNAADPVFKELFVEFCEPPTASSASTSSYSGPNAEGQDRSAMQSSGAGSVQQAHGDEEEQSECFVCHEATEEALIQACACRGTMAAHSSCLLRWIHEHRMSNWDDVPRCGVCMQPYRGQDQEPGWKQFVVSHLVLAPRCVTGMAIRTWRLAVVIGCFALSSMPDPENDAVISNVTSLASVLFWSFWSLQVAVLMISSVPDRIGSDHPLRFLVLEDCSERKMRRTELFIIGATAVIFSIGYLWAPSSFRKLCLHPLDSKSQREIYQMLLQDRKLNSTFHTAGEFQEYICFQWFLLQGWQAIVKLFIVASVSHAIILQGEDVPQQLFAKQLCYGTGCVFMYTAGLPMMNLLLLERRRTHVEIVHQLASVIDISCLLLIVVCILAPCLSVVYYRRWQYRNSSFTLSLTEALLHSADVREALP